MVVHHFPLSGEELLLRVERYVRWRSPTCSLSNLGAIASNGNTAVPQRWYRGPGVRHDGITLRAGVWKLHHLDGGVSLHNSLEFCDMCGAHVRVMSCGLKYVKEHVCTGN